MNIYVIYKFDDHATVQALLNDIKTATEKASFFKFEKKSAGRLWRIHAKKMMSQCDLVVFFDSLVESNPVGKYIRWELALADRLKKRVVVFKKNPDSKDPLLYKDAFSTQDPPLPRYKTYDLAEAVSFITNECNWNVDDALLRDDLKNAPLAETDVQVILEQYRIMIETSERLMERRQETVNLYTTLCTTVIALLGASFAFGNLLLCGIVAVFSGIILCLLSYNWKKSLRMYDLNITGKFEVINRLEKLLPAEIFECEYRFNKLKGLGSFSDRERSLPSMFTVFGVLMFVAAAVTLILF